MYTPVLCLQVTHHNSKSVATKIHLKLRATTNPIPAMFASLKSFLKNLMNISFYRHGHEECVRLLLSRGAQLLRTNDNETPVDIAVKVEIKIPSIIVNGSNSAKRKLI